MKVWPGCLILSGFQASSFTVERCALGTAPLKTSVSLVLLILTITPRSSCLFYINYSISCVVCIPGNELRFLDLVVGAFALRHLTSALSLFFIG